METGQPKKKTDWWRLYCIALITALIGITLIAHKGGYLVQEEYGSWPRRIEYALAGLLYASSIVSIFRNRVMAAVGFVLVVLVFYEGLTWKGLKMR